MHQYIYILTLIKWKWNINSFQFIFYSNFKLNNAYLKLLKLFQYNWKFQAKTKQIWKLLKRSLLVPTSRRFWHLWDKRAGELKESDIENINKISCSYLSTSSN